MTEQLDLLAPAPADAARLPGTIDGPPDWQEGFGAGLRCWVNPEVGWLPLGDVLGRGVGCLTLHEGRLQVGLTFDLGRMALPRRRREDEG